MKEKIGCPITLGEYERIIAEEKKTVKELIKENIKKMTEMFIEIAEDDRE